MSDWRSRARDGGLSGANHVEKAAQAAERARAAAEGAEESAAAAVGGVSERVGDVTDALPAIDPVSNAASDVVAGAAAKTADVVGGVGGAVAGAAAGLSGRADNAAAGARSVVGGLGDAVSDVAGEVASKSGDVVGDVVGGVGGAVAGAAAGLSGRADNPAAAAQSVAGDVTGAASTAVGGLAGRAGRVRDVVGSAGERVGDVVPDVAASVDRVEGAARGAAERVAGGLTGTAKDLAGGAREGADGAVAAARVARNVTVSAERATGSTAATGSALGLATATASTTSEVTTGRHLAPKVSRRVPVVRGKRPLWLLAPVALGLGGLLLWQSTIVRDQVEDDLQGRTERALRARFPDAKLRFEGRDAVVSGLGSGDAAEATRMLREFEGVRSVRFAGGAGSDASASAQATETVPAKGGPDSVADASEAAAVGSGPVTLPITDLAPIATEPGPDPVIVGDSLATSDSLIDPVIADSEPAPETATTATTSATTTATATTSPTVGSETPTTASPSNPASPASAVLIGRPTATVRFAPGGFAVDSELDDVLDSVAATMAATPSLRLRVDGHSDSTGTRVANLAVSGRRADAVRAALIARGVDPDRLIARGFAAARPVASNDTATGRALNRRVDLVFSDSEIRYTG